MEVFLSFNDLLIIPNSIFILVFGLTMYPTLMSIIFKLEVFPWAISLGKIGIFGFTSMMIFLSILTIGFIYEWKKGALDWE